MQPLNSFIVAALSVPFVVGGRSFDGWDCWGLVYCAYRELFGIEINRLDHSYNDTASYREIQKLTTIEKAEWINVLEPRYGDVGLYRVSRYETHVSLVLPNSRMIHCEHTAGTICERLDGLVWGRRNVGYYRRAEAVA